MATLKMTLDGEQFEIDPSSENLTLGESELMQQEYGMSDFLDLNFMNPRQMVGLFAIALKRARPELSDEDIRTKVKGIKVGEVLEMLNKQVEAAEAQAKEKNGGPPPVAATGGRANRRAKPGARRSAGSTA